MFFSGVIFQENILNLFKLLFIKVETLPSFSTLA